MTCGIYYLLYKVFKVIGEQANKVAEEAESPKKEPKAPEPQPSPSASQPQQQQMPQYPPQANFNQTIDPMMSMQ